MLVQFLFGGLHVLILNAEDDEIHGVVEKIAREADVDGSLDFVASEHPKLDTSLCEQLDGIRYAILQTILNGCTAE